MSTSLKDALKVAGFVSNDEPEVDLNEEAKKLHRAKTILERPKTEVVLKAIYNEEFVPRKYSDPTPDLVVLPNGITEEFFRKLVPDDGAGYVIWCEDTRSAWYAPTELCLNQNFIYRDDLDITPNDSESYAWYASRGGQYMPGVITRKSCYILDMPGTEAYEVYYDSNFPAQKYGKATPNGSFVHRYDNRFKRDMAILELDKLYSESSKKQASNKIKNVKLKPTEAIIVSDGAFMKNVCSNAFWYIDSDTVVKMSEGFLPTEPDQSVLIAELRGATNALQFCMAKGKKQVKYYYDNTSVLNCLRNRKTEYIAEVKAYKDILKKLDENGYNVIFIELHPKTGEDRDQDNKALMFFHNSCDIECRDMADIFKKDYRNIAQSDNKSGKDLSTVKQEYRPKGPKNNSKNGNNRYGRIR